MTWYFIHIIIWFAICQIFEWGLDFQTNVYTKTTVVLYGLVHCVPKVLSSLSLRQITRFPQTCGSVFKGLKSFKIYGSLFGELTYFEVILRVEN